MAWTDMYLDLGAGSNGDGTTTSTPWNTWGNAATGLGTTTGNTRLNVKGNVTLGANVTFSPTTAVTTPLWVRGCDASWTDIGDTQTGQPTTTQSTFTFTSTSTYVLYTGLVFTGSPNTALLTIGANCWMHRCSGTNTASVNTAYAITPGANSGASLSLFSASSTTTNYTVNAGTFDLFGCSVRGSTSRGVSCSSGGKIVGNVIVNCKGDGVYMNSNGLIANNLIYGVGGAASKYGINLVTFTLSDVWNNTISGFSGTSASAIFSGASGGYNARMINNWWYNCTSGITGIAESLQIGGGLLASDPFKNAAGFDFTPAASIFGLGVPGRFQGESYTSYPDLGAIQRAIAGGLLLGSDMNGGFQ